MMAYKKQLMAEYLDIKTNLKLPSLGDERQWHSLLYKDDCSMTSILLQLSQVFNNYNFYYFNRSPSIASNPCAVGLS
jgi:hypothetical protein